MSEHWAPDQMDSVKVLWLGGASYSEIQKHFPGRTRSAVAGLVKRMGLPPRKTTEENRVKIKVSHRKAREKMEKSNPKPPTRHEMKGEAIAPLAGIGVSIEALENTCTITQCRYPYGEIGTDTFHFCGNKTKEMTSYCPEHFRLCFQPLKIGAAVSDEDKAVIAQNARATGMQRIFG